MRRHLVSAVQTVAVILIAASAIWLAVRAELGVIGLNRSHFVDEFNLNNRDVVERVTVHGTGIATEEVALGAGLWEARLFAAVWPHGGIALESESADGRSQISWDGEPLLFNVGDLSEAELSPGVVLVKVSASVNVAWSVNFVRFSE